MKNLPDSSKRNDLLLIKSNIRYSSQNACSDHKLGSEDIKNVCTDNESSYSAIPTGKKAKLSERASIVRQFYKKRDESLNCPTNKCLSIRAFMRAYNKNLQHGAKKLTIGSLTNWIKAEKRGDYLSWMGQNDPDSYSVKGMVVVNNLDSELRSRDLYASQFNRVAKLRSSSKSREERYAVLASTFITKGTFLGFFKGEEVNEPIFGLKKTCFQNVLAVNDHCYIDASDHLSCFARYYNCAHNAGDENVEIRRFNSENKQECIQKGSTLQVS